MADVRAAALALCLLAAAPAALAQDGSFSARGDIRPVPDPTVLTTQQLDREISSLREILEARINALEEAQRLFRQSIERVPTETDRAIANLRNQMEERFNSIDRRFSAASDLAAQQNASNILAVSKTEAQMIQQLEQLRELLRTDTGGLRSQVDDLKERLTAMEARAVGQIEAQAQIQGSQVQWVGVLGLIFGVIFGLVGLIVGFIRNREHSSATA